ncbi:MAG: GNAT family N-acetyltransferase [Deltaproteobacteria bacterium]|nr:GNAT family N-acetyltransferase [Deltaproteobacteria bacterium]
MVTVRPLREEEAGPLAGGLAALPLMVRYRREAGRIEADLQAARSRGEGLLVAEERGRLCGLAWFLRAGTLGMGGYLRLLAVLGEAQRSGVGARLLAAWEAEAARESRHAFLLVSDFNEGAQRFYERHGYARCGALPGLVLPDVVELVYWKRLR